MKKTLKAANSFRIKLATDKVRAKYVDMIAGWLLSERSHPQGILDDLYALRSDPESEEFAGQRNYPGWNEADFEQLISLVQSTPQSKSHLDSALMGDAKQILYNLGYSDSQMILPQEQRGESEGDQISAEELNSMKNNLQEDMYSQMTPKLQKKFEQYVGVVDQLIATMNR